MSQKRNRSINWDEDEKQLFRSVLKEYAQIIENKSLDTNTNKIKTKAWEEVYKKFNHLNRRPRDLSQLKIQWKGMKVNARKTYSSFKKEANKTGGGARPATPDEETIKIKYLLNPAELLRDQNPYDSDGVMIGELELPTPSQTCPIKLQVFKQTTSVYDNSNTENEQIDNVCIENFEDVDAQLAVQEFSSLVIPQENAIKATPINKNTDSIPVKTSDADVVTVTPLKKSTSTTPAKKVAKRKIISNITDSGMKPRKDHVDYVNKMIIHSKMLKDEEHIRKMEMAEEEHAIKMEIHKENLKAAIIEREILELKKARETLKQ